MLGVCNWEPVCIVLARIQLSVNMPMECCAGDYSLSVMILGCKVFWEVESQVDCGTAVTRNLSGTAEGVVWETLNASDPEVMGLRHGRRVLVNCGTTGPACL